MADNLRHLHALPELDGATAPELSELQLELARGGLRDSSLQRYMGAARSWKRWCLDRGEPFWNASTATLLAWLNWRVRSSQSPRSALKMGLAAARFVQRGYCVVHELEAIPYTPGARVQLDAYARSCTMNRSDRKVARPLRLDELGAVVRAVRTDPNVRWGVSIPRQHFLAERDAAMMIVGWWGALRADDLARLGAESLHMAPLGVELHLSASKTTHAVLALAAHPEAPYLCPLEALRRLERARKLAAGAELARRRDAVPGCEGALFDLATGDHIGRRLGVLFKRYGLPKGYTGHSLRAGFATECAAQGVPDKLVQAHGRWRSAQQHAEYVRLARLWDDTPTRLVRVAE